MGGTKATIPEILTFRKVSNPQMSSDMHSGAVRTLGFHGTFLGLMAAS
jgi:hypothetical protein